MVKCKSCKKEVAQTAVLCPHCGQKDPGTTTAQALMGCLGLIVISLIFGMILVWCGDSPEEKNWYEGGDLHSATVAEWKQASGRNRLATCADFAAILLAQKKNVITLNSESKYKVYSQNLMVCIDEAEHLEVSVLAVGCSLLLHAADL